MTREPIDAIFLAAGLSRRMGADNKLLLPFAGQPLVRHTAARLLRAGLRRVVAVTGHDAAEVSAALDGLDIEITFNPAFDSGQMRSVSHGLRTLGEGAGAAMIALADMPYLQPADYRNLAAAFQKHGGNRIIVPHFQQERGNPIILPVADVKAVVAGDLNTGCRKLIRDHPDRVFALPVENAAFIRDIDTSAEYSQALKSNHASAPCCG
ncbi:MAG: nucleotidyltransferase family protein [Pseudomonadota bacterium]